ncbi:hypothetical protein NDU88_002529 [Pleurodeles waltl]|uniref:Uncharacterized protein n=1 Tax=Pleurodeles waltl TaxID=8319 RepID=A0AAV7VEM8_PLEWA|nr:hypothetical protein NDU88_002529 [Pleurodeles waltl]
MAETPAAWSLIIFRAAPGGPCSAERRNRRTSEWYSLSVVLSVGSLACRPMKSAATEEVEPSAHVTRRPQAQATVT